MATSTSAISMSNDNDFLIGLFIIHYACQHSKTVRRNVKLNFVFYRVALFRGDVVESVASYASKLPAFMFRDIFDCQKDH